MAVSSSDPSAAETATSWLSFSWPRWIRTSIEDLAAAERRILSYLKTPYDGRFVEVQADETVTRPDKHKIWTLIMNETSPISSIPIVLIHGFGGGVGMWAQNLDDLATRRTLYAIDVLGFGKSSRPNFSSNAESAEQQFVASIESWRKELGLTNFILLGHSLGAFLAASYCLQHPQHVRHLIMVDPWGMPERPLDKDMQLVTVPFWIRTAASLLQPFNPLAGLRAAGPFGPRLVERLRPDLQRKFSTLIPEDKVIFDYIYHCNAQKPSGETAFKAMTVKFGWAKNGMVNRIIAADKRLSVSFVYGSRSWIDNAAGNTVKERRLDSNTEIIMVPGAGHHVYADKPQEFNEIVNRICQRIDREDGIR